MIALLQTLSMILTLVWWVFLIMIIMSWLISFNVINTRNEFVAGLWRVVNAVTEPILRPIRRIIPPMGGLDLSPIVVFVIIFFLQSFIGNDLPRMLQVYSRPLTRPFGAPSPTRGEGTRWHDLVTTFLLPLWEKVARQRRMRGRRGKNAALPSAGPQNRLRKIANSA
jgi:YggT family protein